MVFTNQDGVSDLPKIAKIVTNCKKDEDKTPTRKNERPESDFELIFVDLGIPMGSQNRQKNASKTVRKKDPQKSSRISAKVK